MDYEQIIYRQYVFLQANPPAPTMCSVDPRKPPGLGQLHCLIKSYESSEMHKLEPLLYY